MSLREGLILNYFFEKWLFLFYAWISFFHSSNCFRTVFVPISFANVLSFFCPLTTSPNSGAATSNKTAPILFAAWDYIYFYKGKLQFSQDFVQEHVTKNRKISWTLSNSFRMKYKSKIIIRNLAKQEKNLCNSYGHKMNFFPPVVSLSSIFMLWKEFFNYFLNFRYVNDWYFMYCPVDSMSPFFYFKIERSTTQ